MKRQIGIQEKILGIVIMATVLPILVISLVSIFQRKEATNHIQVAIDNMIVEDLSHIASGFYDLCKTANDFTQYTVNHVLNVATQEVIQQGGFADIVLMDPEKLKVLSDELETRRHPQGIEYVFVNGKAVVENGIHTKATPGQVLTRVP